MNLLKQHPLRRRGAGALRRPGRRAVDRCGAAVVEFAVVAPVFFMLVVGIIEVGRAMMVQQVLINASREGARRASMLASNQTVVLNAVSEYTDGTGVHGVTATVSPDPAAASAGDQITVTATVNFNDVSWMPAPWIMGGKNLTASAVMRKEGF
jgi:Flp pilus assembly protein TadG